jgi:hypothetical protein
MKTILSATLAAACLMGLAGQATAQGNSANAPGQDRTCLVTTGTAGSFNDADVVDSKWLPRKAAEAQASKSPDTMKTFDYSNEPDLIGEGKQYASAEELCNNHFK